MTHPGARAMPNYPPVVVKTTHACWAKLNVKVYAFLYKFLSCKPKFSKNIASQRKGETVSERWFISLHRVDNIKEQGVCKGCENQRF